MCMFCVDIQKGATITRSNIVRYYIHTYTNWGRISIRCWTHKRHSIPRPNICEKIDRVITEPHSMWNGVQSARKLNAKNVLGIYHSILLEYLTTHLRRLVKRVYTMFSWMDGMTNSFFIPAYCNCHPTRSCNMGSIWFWSHWSLNELM